MYPGQTSSTYHKKPQGYPGVTGPFPTQNPYPPPPPPQGPNQYQYQNPYPPPPPYSNGPAPIPPYNPYGPYPPPPNNNGYSPAAFNGPYPPPLPARQENGASYNGQPYSNPMNTPSSFSNQNPYPPHQTIPPVSGPPHYVQRPIVPQHTSPSAHSGIPGNIPNWAPLPPGYSAPISNCRGRKKALLVGINYTGTKAALRGILL